MSPTLLTALSGALVMCYVTIGLFFLRFWRRSRDRLFAIFAASFLLLAVQRLALTVAGEWTEDSIWLYGLRLLAFLLILVAIVDKNRSAPRA
jgi:peptidoglycan/LPS O-acetylase OafA/YrhL